MGQAAETEKPQNRAPAHTGAGRDARTFRQGLPLNRWVKLTVAQRHQVALGSSVPPRPQLSRSSTDLTVTVDDQHVANTDHR